MGSQDSWIDPDEVSHLADEIFPEGRRASAGDEAFAPVSLLGDEDLEGARDACVDLEADGDDDTAQRIGEHLRDIRERAVRAGLLVGDERADEGGHGADEGLPAPFRLQSGRLVEQMDALVNWLAGAGEFDQVFVLDELGDEMVRGEVSAGLRSGAVRLAQSWERSQQWLREDGEAADAPLAGAVVADGRVLSVVGARSANGFFCAGLVGDRLISMALADRVRQALLLVFG